MSAVFDERIIPDETDQGAISIHLKRYIFARDFCRGKQVLDAACGTGYGTHNLASVAHHVTGVDLSSEAVKYAFSRYGLPNISFQIMDVCSFAFPDDSFDVICSFETIEHLRDVETYLRGVIRVMKEDGVYLVSTPLSAHSTHSPKNPFHCQEWNLEDFKRLLGQHFNLIKFFGQKRKQMTIHRWLAKADIFHLREKIHSRFLRKCLSSAVGTTPFRDMRLDDIDIVENDFKNADYIVVVASSPKKGS